MCLFVSAINEISVKKVKSIIYYFILHQIYLLRFFHRLQWIGDDSFSNCPPRSHTLVLKKYFLGNVEENDRKIIIVWTKKCVNWNEILRAWWNYQKLNEFPFNNKKRRDWKVLLICIFITAYNTRFVMDIRIKAGSVLFTGAQNLHFVCFKVLKGWPGSAKCSNPYF